ncbi:ImmA/IrrE family metallo-endopeptidase [Leuconostoc holzapfelii]|uniref:ImmA/IrrE family metallo-endopeptidase n=1 Tax=Leuconostoc holzapfelii TaxID=434464 RepID=A0ABT2NVZ4_9LACO|nr:ImmA/IrrE family metallo-endopeptidase [Leuconostoc holzapfelii]MCT8389544.1 ImmA/IrrE family metallo-endopeptidase [Leuconostoc holzapfelii]
MIKDYLYMQITSSLESLACNNDITLVNAEDLSENVPDTALINTRAVIMNKQFDINVDYSYRLAHELSHILYGDHEAQAVYQFSEYGKRGEELLAHRNAIRMLMAIEPPSNPFTFMSYYRVPSWLENDVMRTYNEFKAV